MVIHEKKSATNEVLDNAVGGLSVKRNRTRKANEAAERAARGGRDITDDERRYIRAFQMAKEGCDSCVDRIKNGRPFNLDAINAAFILGQVALGLVKS